MLSLEQSYDAIKLFQQSALSSSKRCSKHKMMHLDWLTKAFLSTMKSASPVRATADPKSAHELISCFGPGERARATFALGIKGRPFKIRAWRHKMSERQGLRKARVVISADSVTGELLNRGFSLSRPFHNALGSRRKIVYSGWV